MVNSSITAQPLISQAIFMNDFNRVRDLVLNRENINGEDTDGRCPLHAASFTGSGDVADFLLLSGARVDKKDNRWQTPLHYACNWCRVNVVEVLLAHNADVGQRDRYWQTALHVCAVSNAVQCAEFLLSSSTKILSLGDRGGRTPLHCAAYHGHMEMVELLIRYQADVNSRDKSERRPIHLAAVGGHLDVVKQLVKAGADVAAKDKNCATTVHCAASCGHDAVCSFLLSEEFSRFQYLINAVQKDRCTPLHVAANNGKEMTVKVLVDHGSNVNAKNGAGMTPLHLAAASTDGSACVDLLIESKADVNLKANDGRTPLHMLASYCRLKQAQSLLDSGADVNATDNDGDTALHIAARHGHDLLIKKLISAGADVKASNSHGVTPLHLACNRGTLEPVKTLIENRADIFAFDNDGRNCLHYVAFSSHNAMRCIEYLLENGASVASADEFGRLPLHYACMANSPDHVEGLLKAGSDANAPDKDGRQPLHYAAAKDTDTKCAFLLLQQGALSVCYDNRGWTPLHYASYRGHMALAEYLVSEKHGDEIDNVLRRLPCTPLHLAAHKGHKELLEMLLRRTKRADPRDRFGCTPLHWATYSGQFGCVKSLLHSSANCLAVDKILKTTPMHVAAGFRQTPILRMMISEYLNDSTMASAFDCRKRTPVMLSASNGTAELMLFLLSLNPDVTIKDVKGRSALHRAAMQGSEKVMEMLLQYLRLCQKTESAIFARDSTGRTPFHYAAQAGLAGTLAMLLREVPSDIQVKAQQQPDLLDLYDSSGQTPLHWSCFNGAVECVELLMDSPLKSHLWEERGGITSLHCAASIGSEVCCELLFERGTRTCIENMDERGRTALHLACASGHVECVRVLLTTCAFVNAVDQRRMTPIMYAAKNGYCQIVEKLLEAEADLSFVDINKRTALHQACLKGQEEAAVLLIGTNVEFLNRQDFQGKTAMHIAVRASLVNVVEKLLLAGASVMIVDENDQTPLVSCAVDQNMADCLALIVCVMFPESTPLMRLSSSGSGTNRLSITGQNVLYTRCRSSGDGEKVIATKENASASSAQSSDSEFF